MKTARNIPAFSTHKSARTAVEAGLGKNYRDPFLALGKASARNVQLDPVIHERTRLSILTALFTTGEPASFSDLRDTLSLTDGNLMTHLRTLDESGLVALIKQGAGRNSSTMIELSSSGRKAFKNYLDQLEVLVRAARGK